MEPPPTLVRLRLLRNKSIHDRPAKLIHGVRDAWDLIGSNHQDALSLALALTGLLRDPDDIALARMVLPALRHGAGPADHDLQRQIVQQTADARAQLDRCTLLTQRDFDHPYYLEEKAILQDAELYRLGLLLYHSGVLDDRCADQVQEWLKACPLRDRGGPASTTPSQPTTSETRQRDDSFDVEKDKLREADMHLLRLLHFSSAVLSEREREAVLAWLELCPL